MASVLVAGGAAFCTFLLMAWWAWAGDTVASTLSQRLGRPATVGAVYPWMREGQLVLVVRDVQIWGEAPFHKEVLAACEQVEVTPGSPPRIRAHGLELTLLAAPGADNARGARTIAAKKKRPSHPGGGRGWPEVEVVSGRLTAQIALPGGGRLGVRVPRLEAASRAGAVHARLFDAVADVVGIATSRIAELSLEATANGDVLLEGKDLSFQLPGGAAFAQGLVFEGLRREGGLSISVKSSPRGPSHLQAQAHITEEGVEVEASAESWPLDGLAPLLDRLGMNATAAVGSGRFGAHVSPGNRSVPWQAELSVVGLSLHHPALDRQVWPSGHLRLEAHGNFNPSERRLTLDDALLAPFGFPVQIAGWLTLAGPPNGRLSLRTPASGWSCAALPSRLPTPLQHHLAGLQMSGQLEAAVDVAFDAAAWDKLALDFRLPSTCVVTQEPRRLDQNLEVLLDARGALPDRPELPLASTNPEFTPLTKLPVHVLSAFLTAEDSGFFMHKGFEPDNIRRALIYNIERGRFVRGASTITQQVAKNLFLSHERTLARKAVEAFLSWRLEALVPKRRVLEMYLNLVELGPGIHGVGAAARAYFGKEPGALTPLEAAHLASLPPNPKGFARRFREGSVDEGWLARLYDLVGIMGRRGQLSPAQVAAARGSRLRLRKI